jgi:hypothetical protein
LEKLLRDCQSHGGYEDAIYRFYHHSFKVYALQETTSAIVASLQSLAPDRKLNESFMAIVRDGTGKTFEREHNRQWLEVTRPHRRGVLPRAVLPRNGRALREAARPAAAAVAERLGRVPLPLRPAIVLYDLR